jgi:hypothetical protein
MVALGSRSNLKPEENAEARTAAFLHGDYG